MKKSKSPSKRAAATEKRDKAAKPLRDLKVTKTADTGVRGGMTIAPDYGSTDYSEY